MARNEEKALTLFSKWQTFKKEFHSVAQNKRPLVSKECQSLPEAEKHRRDAMREATKKIASIQNASLGEHRIRELNDEINKHMRQKHYWEMRIRELGGSDYHTLRKQVADIDGKELPGAPNYKYYGAAKNLPGVRELFAEVEEAAEKQRLQRNRGEVRKDITPSYYGFENEFSEDILKKEKRRENELIQTAIEEHKSKKIRLIENLRRIGGLSENEKRNGNGNGNDEDNNNEASILTKELNEYVQAEKEALEYDIATIEESNDNNDVKSNQNSFGIIYQIAIPSQEEIMKLALEEKKKNLLNQFIV